VVTAGTLDGRTNVHIVVVLHPLAGYEAFYTNGVLVGTTPILNNLIDPIAYATPASTNSANSHVNTTFNSQSVVAATLGADPLNYLGLSLYGVDALFNGSIDEFRIYNGPLTAAQIAADYSLGPNKLAATPVTVPLTVALKSGSLVISWPATTPAQVSLMTSPALGTGAVWSPVTGSPANVGGNYQMTVPISGAARYFQLRN
jgi:hypothetical protein